MYSFVDMNDICVATSKTTEIDVNLQTYIMNNTLFDGKC